MTRTARLWIYMLSTTMMGFCLNVMGILVVASTSGLPGLPEPFLLLVRIAYWPSWLIGIPQLYYFNPDISRPFITNMVGWLALGGILALLHNALTSLRSSVLRKSPRDAQTRS